MDETMADITLDPSAWWERPASFNLVVLHGRHGDTVIDALDTIGFGVRRERPFEGTLPEYLARYGAPGTEVQKKGMRLLVETSDRTVYVEPTPQVVLEEAWLHELYAELDVPVRAMLWERVSQTVALYARDEAGWNWSSPVVEPDGTFGTASFEVVRATLAELGLPSDLAERALTGRLLSVSVPADHRVPQRPA